jgi:signal transduction histidine kinase/DNA-binding NarL/FixJ family response regulator
MLIPGTQMDIVTFIFVCIEIVIFFYLVIYKLARPDNVSTNFNIVLITLLLIYNITGGLLPDPSLPGSRFMQEIIAYGTGFITPCYFPYYVYQVFDLKKMKFHAKKGVFVFLFLPYLLFIFVYRYSGSLETAKNLLALPVLYAVWIIVSLVKAIKEKYRRNSGGKKNEARLLFLSIAPWIGLPVVAYFDLDQAVEASITNVGFLLLLFLQVSSHIRGLRLEHVRLQHAEKRLLHWNNHLQEEVHKRTKELEKIIEQRTDTFVNLAHETKTPLTLINNYLDEYISKNGLTEELSVVRSSLAKLSGDIVNLFDIERFDRGLQIYNHSQVTDFSQTVSEETILFRQYAIKKDVRLISEVDIGIFIKADPVAINRLINNLIENAIKFSAKPGEIIVSLKRVDGQISFSVADSGPGIPAEFHDKIFQPYFQMALHKTVNQGIGLGLAIVKKIVSDLDGTIEVINNKGARGTWINVILHEYKIKQPVTRTAATGPSRLIDEISVFEYEEKQFIEGLPTILLLEDNPQMAGYLVKKLRKVYNVHVVKSGHDGLERLKNKGYTPDLIISDVMMNNLDGYNFARVISSDTALDHIPLIFLSARSSSKDRLEGLRSGAIDFIAKPFLIEELMGKAASILRLVNRQKSFFVHTGFHHLKMKRDLSARGEESFYDRCLSYHLSSRETDILKRILTGKKYREIAEALFISEKTVNKHVQNIFCKVKVNSKVMLINRFNETA